MAENRNSSRRPAVVDRLAATLQPHLPPALRRAYDDRRLPLEFASSWFDGRRNAKSFGDVDTYCMFIGYPRSGHSVVGSLLDAHPDAVIAHELDALRYVNAHFTRDQLFALILNNDRQFSEAGRKAATAGYDYSVPNQWQGRFRRLQVVGDKRGGRSTIWLQKDLTLLDRLRKTVDVRVRLIHVIRNPYDNISTAVLRRGPAATLDAAVETYFARCRFIARLNESSVGSDIFELRHEQLIAEPKMSLKKLCHFVGLDPTDDYLSDCSGILYQSPNRSRHSAPWTDKLKQTVQDNIAQIEFLDGYSFDS